MPGDSKNGMQCAEFDLFLSDALDDALTGEARERFLAHASACQNCAPLWAEAQAGMKALREMAEVAPPANLVHNILARTSGIDTARLHTIAAPQLTWSERLRDWIEIVAAPVWATVRQPRFVMSFGMAFFSLSVALSIFGVKLTDVSKLDLRPSALKRSYYETSGRFVKYYENIRFVYEIESRVRAIKRATTPAEPAPEEQHNDRQHKDNTSGQPELRQERNYSRGENEPVLASAPDSPPEMWLATYRRIS
jgi:hypothetical protein